MSKIDIDKFVASLIEFSPQQSIKYIKALEDQGLEYKDGKIVSIDSDFKTITIQKDLKGTDTDGGVVGKKGEQGEQGNNPEAESISAQIDSLKRRIEDNQLGCIVQRLDKIIKLLQSAILPIPRETYVPPIIKNPLDPDPNTLGGWETTASTEGGGE